MGRIWMALGSLFGASGVAMAAYAAHALPQRLAARELAATQSAIQMQFWHALALMLAGMWALRAPRRAAHLANLSGAGFACGVLLFCGGLYASTLGGLHSGPAAPIGGVLLILAWLALAASAALAGQAP